MTTPNLFYFEGSQIRSVLIDDQPWFVLKDICEVLELSSPHKVAERLDDDERNLIPLTDSLGRSQETTIINESGLYSVLLRSDKPQAKPFQKWVTSEVLPTIRKKGSYSVQPQQPAQPVMASELDLIISTANVLKQQQEQLAVHARRLDTVEVQTQRLEAEVLCTSRQLGEIHKRAQRLGHLIGYGRAWRLFNDRFGLASYRDLPRGDFEAGIEFLELQLRAYDRSGRMLEVGA